MRDGETGALLREFADDVAGDDREREGEGDVWV